jgi:cytidylate kinase
MVVAPPLLCPLREAASEKEANVFRTSSPIHLTEALMQANQHWHLHHKPEEAKNPALTIALSREAGTYGAAIAREVGNRLPVYDSELLQRIAEDLGIRRNLLESVDERHVGWLTECLEGLSSAPALSQSAYLRHLLETLLALAARGDCVIVGRGATKVLPLATTLRVRVVAPLEHRIEAVRREHGTSHEEAARQVDTTDRERDEFVREHFHMDPTDPRNYDLVLNVARFGKEECAGLIIAALDPLRAHQNPGRTAHSEPVAATV